MVDGGCHGGRGHRRRRGGRDEGGVTTGLSGLAGPMGPAGLTGPPMGELLGGVTEGGVAGSPNPYP